MLKRFMLIFGLLLVVICYHSPPGEVKVSNEINYDLPGEMNKLPVPVITTEERGTTPVVIKEPIHEVKAHSALGVLIIQNPCLAIMSNVRKISIKNKGSFKGSFKDLNYIAYIRINKVSNLNIHKVRRLSAEILQMKGLLLLSSYHTDDRYIS